MVLLHQSATQGDQSITCTALRSRVNSLTNCSFDAVPVSLLIVHQLVMCQNFLMLRYSMLIADGAARFFLNDGTSNIRYCYQTSYYVVRRVCTSILIVHNLGMVKNFYKLIVENHIYKILLPMHSQVPFLTYSKAPPLSLYWR